jgi:hypothetical protein
VQLADTDADEESGPEYVVEVHEAIPEVASLPEALIPTAWLYQPFESGPRAAETELSVGGVASFLTVPFARATSEPVPTTQSYDWPEVSDVTSKLLQPDTSVPATVNVT